MPNDNPYGYEAGKEYTVNEIIEKGGILELLKQGGKLTGFKNGQQIYAIPPKSTPAPQVEPLEVQEAEQPVEEEASPVIPMSHALEVKEEKTHPLNAPLAVQRVYFYHDFTNEDYRLKNLSLYRRLQQRFNRVVHSVFNVSISTSDCQLIGMNLKLPTLRQLPYRYIKISKHEQVIAPNGKAVDFYHYHGDGADASNNTQREFEQTEIAKETSQWYGLQQQKAQSGQDSSGDCVWMGDFNISAFEYDKERGLLVWNKTFIEMLKRAFPDGIYGLSVPELVVDKKRGATNEKGEGTGLSIINSQALKDDVENYASKTIIVHLRTDKNGRPVKGFDPDSLLMRDPDTHAVFGKPAPDCVHIENLKFSKTMKDHGKAQYVVHGICATSWGNMSTQGYKGFKLPASKFKPSALTETGTLKEETILKSQICLTELAKCLDYELFGIKSDDSRPLVKRDFALRFNKEVTTMLNEEKNNPGLLKNANYVPVRKRLHSAIVTWFFSAEYDDLCDMLLENPEERVKRQEKNGVSVTFADYLVDKMLGEEKSRFDEAIKIFDAEPSGGFMFADELGPLDNARVDQLQAKTSATEVAEVMRGKTRLSGIILGGDSGTKDGTNVQATYHLETESHVLPDCILYNLPEDNKFDSNANRPLIAEWVKAKVLNDNRPEQDVLVRYKGEIYYVNKTMAAVNHIAATNDLYKDIDAKQYANFVKKFVDAEKTNAPFKLDLKKDNKILDIIFKNGPTLKGSKDIGYHNNIQFEFNIEEKAAQQQLSSVTQSGFGVFPVADSTRQVGAMQLAQKNVI